METTIKTEPLETFELSQPGEEDSPNIMNIDDKVDIEPRFVIKENEKPCFKCSICDKTFLRKSNLLFHKTVHKGVREFGCDLCEKRFYTLPHLSRHKKIHDGDRPYKCEVCKRTFVLSANLANHMKYYIPGQQCKNAKYQGYTVQPTETTMKNECIPQTPIIENTDFTQLKEADQNRLSKVARSPKIKATYNCPQCPKSFSSSAKLSSHLAKKHGLKLFKCDICQREFGHASGLSRHRRSHEGEASVTAPIIKFTERIRVAYVPRVRDGLKTHKCNECNKVFVHSSGLSRHKISHRPLALHFRCHTCDKSFTQPEYLIKHLTFHITHDTLGKYKCMYCNRDYKYISLLNHHQRLSHGQLLHENHKMDINYDESTSGVSIGLDIPEENNYTPKQNFTEDKVTMAKISQDFAKNPIPKMDINNGRILTKGVYLNGQNTPKQTNCIPKMGTNERKGVLVMNGGSVVNTNNYALPKMDINDNKDMMILNGGVSIAQNISNENSMFKMDFIDTNGISNNVCEISSLEMTTVVDGERCCICMTCKKSFTKASILLAHQKTCSGKKCYKCKRCSESFNQLCDFLSHQREHI